MERHAGSLLILIVPEWWSLVYVFLLQSFVIEFLLQSSVIEYPCVASKLSKCFVKGAQMSFFL